ncbi:MAG TPA: hypothetical protein PK082_06535 [Phycisphaerae bacterium]|nr:hypothetical protein [Phycisphaerae bacterium]
MRLGLIVVMLAGIAVAVVHIRRAEITARHEILRLQEQRGRLRREAFDQQVRISRLIAPGEVQKRVKELGIPLVGPGEKVEGKKIATRAAPAPGRN